jgi:hypothetical protein
MNHTVEQYIKRSELITQKVWRLRAPIRQALDNLARLPPLYNKQTKKYMIKN